MQDTDVAITALYEMALFDSPADYRNGSMSLVCRTVGAESAAWVTHNALGVIGEVTLFPESLTVSPVALVNQKLDAKKAVSPLPVNGSKKRGCLVRYAHRRTGLISSVAFWFADGAEPKEADLVRLVGHVSESGALSLRNFIHKDEQLAGMGRPSRGATALVDASGVIYAASGRFVDLVQDEFHVDAITHLPFTIPDEALAEDGLFSQGNLRFRSSRLGNLYMMHARQPQPLDTLSPREQQIARALGRGKTFKSVARQCGIAVSTVANHASRIYRKLGIYRREDLVEMVRTSRIAERPDANAN